MALQPNDVFVKQPDCLFPRKRDLDDPESEVTDSAEDPKLTSKQPQQTHKAVGSQFATDHQILIYL